MEVVMDKDIKIDCSFLLCPCCQDGHYQHIIRVGTELDPDGDETQIYRGTSRVFETGNGERRSSLRIDLAGECGHYWSLILNQHKGTIGIWARVTDDPTARPDDQSMTIEEHLFKSIRRITYKMEEAERNHLKDGETE
jgi:hypothetical protein